MRDVQGAETEDTDDPDLWALLQRERRLLITTDKGLGQCRGAPHHGVLIVRLRQSNRDNTHGCPAME